MSEVDKDLSARYRAAASDAPPPHVDAAILAAAKRAVGSQAQATWTPRAMRRWYVPVSLAAVIMLSVIVTLRMEHERPGSAMPDAVPLERQEEAPIAQKLPEPQAIAPPAAVSRPAPKTAPVQPVARAHSPESGPARDAAAEQTPREESLRSAETAGNQAGTLSAAAPATSRATLAKRELAPDAWLERIADLRKQGQDKEADEQLAEFKRRYPDHTIPEPMMERIAPRK